MLPILPETAWREFRSAPKTRGHNLTTHQALIADPTGREHKCFVKASPPGYPMPLAEGLAWLVAEALDLPRPKFAALLLLPVCKLRQCMPLDQHWIQTPYALAFCSSTVDGKHVTSPWKWLARMRTVRAFSHDDVSRIAAFDMWIDNQDRNSGNLLRTKAGDYVPIDNEFALYSLIWAAANITVESKTLRAQAGTMLKPAGYAKFEGSMMVAATEHKGAFIKCSPTLQEFLMKMAANPVEGTQATAAILQFLGQRADPGWLANELGLIS